MNLEHRAAADLFATYQVNEPKPAAELMVTESDWQEMTGKGFVRDGQTEASLLTAFASDALLAHNRMIIHAVAFSFQGRAWLITAPPRVGKSTQIRYLMDMYPNEFSVICGDRPVLQLMDDGTFFVHPSPWNGKENWKGAPGAQLAGILCLQRDDTTSIRAFKPREAILPVFYALISTRGTEAQIRMISAMETVLLNSITVYEYHNGGVPDSTRVLYDFLTKWRDDR